MQKSLLTTCFKTDSSRFARMEPGYKPGFQEPGEASLPIMKYALRLSRDVNVLFNARRRRLNSLDRRFFEECCRCSSYLNRLRTMDTIAVPA